MYGVVQSISQRSATQRGVSNHDDSLPRTTPLLVLCDLVLSTSKVASLRIPTCASVLSSRTVSVTAIVRYAPQAITTRFALPSEISLL